MPLPFRRPAPVHPLYAFWDGPPNGNLATKTEGTDSWVYTWTAENQLTKVEKNGVEQARFAYDPLGRRVEKVAGGVTTSYTYDDEDILRELRGTTTRKYVHGPEIDEALAVDEGSSLSYLHADGLGSIDSMTNDSGATTLARRYDAWGNLESGASEAGYAFTGREWDPETRLYYYRARYYDPRTGRFVSEDPVRLHGGNNFYVFVAGNPVLRTDPSGLYERYVPPIPSLPQPPWCGYPLPKRYCIPYACYRKPGMHEVLTWMAGTTLVAYVKVNYDCTEDVQIMPREFVPEGTINCSKLDGPLV